MPPRRPRKAQKENEPIATSSRGLEPPAPKPAHKPPPLTRRQTRSASVLPSVPTPPESSSADSDCEDNTGPAAAEIGAVAGGDEEEQDSATDSAPRRLDKGKGRAMSYGSDAGSVISSSSKGSASSEGETCRLLAELGELPNALFVSSSAECWEEGIAMGYYHLIKRIGQVRAIVLNRSVIGR